MPKVSISRVDKKNNRHYIIGILCDENQHNVRFKIYSMWSNSVTVINRRDIPELLTAKGYRFPGIKLQESYNDNGDVIGASIYNLKSEFDLASLHAITDKGNVIREGNPIILGYTTRHIVGITEYVAIDSDGKTRFVSEEEFNTLEFANTYRKITTTYLTKPFQQELLERDLINMGLMRDTWLEKQKLNGNYVEIDMTD